MPVIPKADVKTPSLTVGGTELSCHGRKINIPADRKPSKDTWCSSGVTHRLEVSFFQSWGAGGLEAVLRPLVNTSVEIIFNPESGTVASVDNPMLKGIAKVPPFDFINVEPGDDDEGVTLLDMSFTFQEGSLKKSVADGVWDDFG